MKLSHLSVIMQLMMLFVQNGLFKLLGHLVTTLI